jgi:NitT/TauT family transport system ATP-binding protein
MINIKNLSVTYTETNHLVINDLSLNITRGKTVAILGPSGCGKTTLLNVIADLFSKGEILKTGIVTIGRNREIGIVFQEPRLLPWRSVIENILFSLEAHHETNIKKMKGAEEALSMIGLEKFRDYYPDRLSLGMQQRVNFARALAIRPDILLLDEPFSGLDRSKKFLLMKDFKALINQFGMTTIFVTHNIEEARHLADYIVYLTASPARIRKIEERPHAKK